MRNCESRPLGRTSMTSEYKNPYRARELIHKYEVVELTENKEEAIVIKPNAIVHPC